MLRLCIILLLWFFLFQKSLVQWGTEIYDKEHCYASYSCMRKMIWQSRVIVITMGKNQSQTLLWAWKFQRQRHIPCLCSIHTSRQDNQNKSMNASWPPGYMAFSLKFGELILSQEGLPHQCGVDLWLYPPPWQGQRNWKKKIDEITSYTEIYEITS